MKIKLTYITKDGKVREEIITDPQTLEDLIAILERNGAKYTVEDIAANGYVRIPA